MQRARPVEPGDGDRMVVIEDLEFVGRRSFVGRSTCLRLDA
jgi:hypothetical protein